LPKGQVSKIAIRKKDFPLTLKTGSAENLPDRCRHTPARSKLRGGQCRGRNRQPWSLHDTRLSCMTLQDRLLSETCLSFHFPRF